MKTSLYQSFIVLPLAGVALCAQAAGVIDEDRYAAARAEFAVAYVAAAAGVPAPPEDSERLAAYPLYPYLQAARLRRELNASPVADDLDARIGNFLSQQGDAVSARDLKRAWLLNLADRNVWALYLANYPEGTTDITLRCHAVAARLALSRPTPTLAADVSMLWLSGDKSPPACDPAFIWLRTQPLWTPELIEKRTRLMLQAGNAAYARSLAASLPAERAAPLLQWAALIENPQSAIAALIAQPARPVEREALLDGWTRFSRKTPDTAEALWPSLQTARGLGDPAVASPFQRALALGLSWSRLPSATDAFNRIAPADRDMLALEWWVRAALWNGDWPQVEKVVALMPESMRSQQRWRYWALRASAAQGEDGADALLAQLAGEDGWYPALASAQLHRPYAPHPDPIPLNGAVQAQIAVIPAIVRAHELFLVAQRPLATAEWSQAVEALGSAERTQSIGLAARWGWYDQAVATATRQMIFTDYELLYPRPYDAPVRSAAAMFGVPENLIYGVIRQETLYRADAVSKANAFGLMQLIRETAARTARRNQLPAPGGDALFDPATNISIGTAHLRELIDRFGGQIPLAVAGYNAGPNAVPRWLPDEPLDLDIWVENIPYNETRTYVQRVLWHSLIFGWRGDGKPQKLDAWLTPVSAAAADESDAQ